MLSIIEIGKHMEAVAIILIIVVGWTLASIFEYKYGPGKSKKRNRKEDKDGN
jgi:hypothetical protein